MLIDLGNLSEGIVYFAPIPLYYKIINIDNITQYNKTLSTIAKNHYTSDVLRVPDEDIHTRYNPYQTKLYKNLNYFTEHSNPSIGKWHGIKTNNFLSLEEPEVKFLQNYIIKEYKKILSVVNNPNAFFNFPSSLHSEEVFPIITESWIQFYQDGDSKMLHNHERYENHHDYKNLWSGAYYINDGNPRDHVKYSGLFSFKVRETHYYIKPIPGLIIMWQSDLLHQVHEFYGDEERVVLNWNIAHK